MPVYQPNKRHLNEAINTVLAQSYVNFELLIQIDEPDLNLVLPQDKRIKTENNQKNYGISTTRNIALSRSNGSWIVPLDQDDRLPDKALQTYFSNITPFINWVLGEGVNFGDNKWRSEYKNIGYGRISGELMLESSVASGFSFHTMQGCFKASIAKGLAGWPAFPRDEDIGFLIKMFQSGEGLILPEITYNYRRHSLQTSQSRTFIEDEGRYKDMLIENIKTKKETA